nr:DUF481 domain-containing protein [Dyella sp. ASV24]
MKRKWTGCALLAALVSVGAQAGEAPSNKNDGSLTGQSNGVPSTHNNGTYSPQNTGASSGWGEVKPVASEPKAIVPDGWSGSARLGLSYTSGNTRQTDIDGKFELNFDNEQWKDNFYLQGLRSRSRYDTEDAQGKPVQRMSTTENRYDIGASVGYKLDPRSYIVTAARYGRDAFAANLWTGVVSVGYGYIALNTERNYLFFEVGPGYRRYRPADVGQWVYPPAPDVAADENTASNGTGAPEPTYVMVRQKTRSGMIGRGLVGYTFRINDRVSLGDSLLIEAGSGYDYYQNDLDLTVNMTEKLALSVGWQVRYNSNAQNGTRPTDSVLTTNVVYSF